MKALARTVGVLFIVGTICGILSVILTGPILNDPSNLKVVAENETRLLIGAILILVMAFSLAMIPVVLYPLLSKYSQALALGAVLFRGALEAVAYIIVVFSLLMLITVSRESIGASGADAVNLQNIGTLLRGAEDWGVHIVSIVFSLGALMIYYLFYISRLIPRWLAIWGLVGAILYLTAPLFDIFGLEQLAFLMAPLALQEMVLAVWLIVKGFNHSSSADVIKS